MESCTPMGAGATDLLGGGQPASLIEPSVRSTRCFGKVVGGPQKAPRKNLKLGSIWRQSGVTPGGCLRYSCRRKRYSSSYWWGHAPPNIFETPSLEGPWPHRLRRPWHTLTEKAIKALNITTPDCPCFLHLNIEGTDHWLWAFFCCHFVSFVCLLRQCVYMVPRNI